MKNPPSWLVIFVVAPFNKIPVFFKDLITFTISFISLFVRLIPEPVTLLELFLPIILSPVSTKRLVSSSLGALFFNSFTNEFFIEFPGDDIISLITEANILGGPNRNPPKCTILDNWVFEDFVLADETFAKDLQIFKTCVSAITIYVEN